MEQRILSPINGNAEYCFQSIDDSTGITSFLDYETGFTSNSKLKIDSDYVKQAEKNQPKLVTELRVLDELREIVWYPSVINIPGKGMIFPMGDKDNWQWEVMKVRDVTEEEKEKYPLSDKEGEYFKTILDVKGKLNFSNDKFMDALKEIGGVVDLDDE